MSKRYKGALLSATPPTTTGGTTGSGSAGGVWTLQQEMQAKGNNAWPEAGNYIEDVFSTYLYTGAGASGQTITNGIDLSVKGGLVWIKNRSAAISNRLFDTSRGAYKELYSDLTSAQVDRTGISAGVSSFGTTGFSLGANNYNGTNQSSINYASWTFRKQPKFFDVVTYTGNGAARTISHNLGSVPGCIITKCTSSINNWYTYHRSTGNANELRLNTTAAAASGSLWNSTDPTSTVFSLGASSDVNSSGETYVAYLFAHDAGGFGLTGTDNVISCGSFGVGGGLDGVVNLGWEPQWVMFKQAQVGGSGNWRIVDNMRGCSTGNTTGDQVLSANLSSAEADAGLNMIDFNATGFTVKDGSVQGGNPYIYIAIRRGPMKKPTDGTKVFSPIARTGTGTATTTTAGFPVDLVIDADRSKTSISSTIVGDRMRGGGRMMYSDATSAEVDVSASNYWNFDSNTGLRVGAADNPFFNNTGVNYINWNFRRAPSFFDEVCWTGVSIGTADTVPYNHNLGVIPELVICKSRYDGTRGWGVWAANNNVAASVTGLSLNTTAAALYPSSDFTPYMTASIFTPGVVYNAAGQTANFNTWTYVGYLFASCPGVSKVGGYTGTGTTLQVNCGFTSGARFVLIKRTDSTGDWYVWDTARGIVSGNDPYLLLNSTSAEVTSTDYIDTYAAGFELSSTAPAALNASGGTYIFLAIA